MDTAQQLRMLSTAVQDLLSELRITPECLRVMSEGVSPDYPGSGVAPADNPGCRVQLSALVASKLIACDVNRVGHV